MSINKSQISLNNLNSSAFNSIKEPVSVKEPAVNITPPTDDVNILEKLAELISINQNAYELTSDLKEKNESERNKIFKECKELDKKYEFQFISHDLRLDLDKNIEYSHLEKSLEILVLKDKQTNEITLIFPGTQLDKDHIKNDLKADANLELGNASHIYNLQKALFSVLANLNVDKDTKISIMGHSLGGHYAQASKMLLANEDYYNIDLITFDSPGCEKSMQQYCKENYIDYDNLVNKMKDNEKKGYTKHFLAEGNNLINMAGGARLEGEEYALENKGNKFGALKDNLKIALKLLIYALKIIKEANKFLNFIQNPLLKLIIEKGDKISENLIKTFNITEKILNTTQHKLKSMNPKNRKINITPLNDKAKNALKEGKILS